MFLEYFLAEFHHEMQTTRALLPRAAVLRTYLLNHLIHHRGQLSVHLRLLDVPLPSISGPTADDAR